MFSGFDVLLMRLRRHGWALLALALSLVLLQTATLARSAPHGSVGGESGLSEICTVQGVITVNANGEPVLPASSDAGHDCCASCILAAPALPDTARIAVPPAPTCGTQAAHVAAPYPGRDQYRAPPSRAPPSA